MPQCNRVVEQVLSCNVMHALAMRILTGWSKDMQGKLRAEANKIAGLMWNLVPSTYSTVPPYQQFIGEKSDIYPYFSD